MNRKQRRAAQKRPGSAGEIARRLHAALPHHRAGRLSEAEALYRSVLEIEPDNVDALQLLGVLAHQSGRHALAIEQIERAIALARSPNASFHNNLGEALRAEGRLDDAVSHYERALVIQPDHPDALGNLAIVEKARGRLPEAISYQERALLLEPAVGRRYVDLGASILELGNVPRALTVAVHALEVEESRGSRTLFVRCVRAGGALSDEPRFLPLVVRALSEAWGRPTELSKAAAELMKADPALGEYVTRANACWPRRLTAEDLVGAEAVTAMLASPLLRCLLESSPVADVGLERLLTGLRSILLDTVHEHERLAVPAGVDLGFRVSLAQQCFVNEYVYAATESEASEADRLRERVVDALRSDGRLDAAALATVALYFPLGSLPGIDRALGRSWPEPVSGLLRQQVLEPREESASRASIPALTPIEAEISRTVRRQYEENPYPRWVRAAAPGRTSTIDELMRGKFPAVQFRTLGRSAIELLIAGCGTGQHPTETARRFPAAKVLAIDLSLSSLAYAVRKTRELGLTNVEYGQADILELASIGRTFDVIESSGVLHHLSDPLAGLRVLASILKPDGFLRLGLYSELARQDVVQGRAFIADRGYGGTAAEIRECRQELMSAAAGSPLRALAEHVDFFSTSTCRDLLFHVQEHRLTLPQLDEALRDAGLEFLGFELDAAVIRAFRARFPRQEDLVSLTCWHAFETENPRTFVGMYQFWTQKR
jgi:tetratricopeptide (TPR) repeat protein/SAM-dependent methyltransferase